MTAISNALHRIFVRLFGTQFSKEGFVIYIRNIQWVTVGKSVTLLFSFVTTMVIARILGPETFGTLNYVLSLVTIFAVISNLGIDNVIYKELVARKEDRENILGSAIALKLFTGLAAIALAAVSLLFMNETPEIKTLTFLLTLSFLCQPLALLGYDFMKDNEPKYTTMAQALSLFLTSLLKIIVVVLTSSLFYFVLILVVENLILGLIYAFQIKRIKRRTLAFRTRSKEVAYILSLAIPLTLSSAFTEIYSRIDQVMLKHYVDEKAVGLYAAAVRLTEVWYVIPNILFPTFFPALINSSSNTTEYRKRFRMFALLLLGLSLLIAAVTFIFSPLMVRIVFGPEFMAATPLLATYVFSLIGSFISFLAFHDLMLKNKRGLLVFLPALTALINIGLNLLLIPSNGALGAALATVISYNLVPFLYLIFRPKTVYKTTDLQ